MPGQQGVEVYFRDHAPPALHPGQLGRRPLHLLGDLFGRQAAPDPERLQLRARLLAELPERTDEEIAAEEIGGEHVLRFGAES